MHVQQVTVHFATPCKGLDQLWRTSLDAAVQLVEVQASSEETVTQAS